MIRRLTPAGWVWTVYALALILGGYLVAAALGGCAAAPAPAAALQPGSVCVLQLQGHQARAVVIGQAHGLVDVRTDVPGFAVVMVAPAELTGCRP